MVNILINILFKSWYWTECILYNAMDKCSTIPPVSVGTSTSSRQPGGQVKKHVSLKLYNINLCQKPDFIHIFHFNFTLCSSPSEPTDIILAKAAMARISCVIMADCSVTWPIIAKALLTNFASNCHKHFQLSVFSNHVALTERKAFDKSFFLLCSNLFFRNCYNTQSSRQVEVWYLWRQVSSYELWKFLVKKHPPESLKQSFLK